MIGRWIRQKFALWLAGPTSDEDRELADSVFGRVRGLVAPKEHDFRKGRWGWHLEVWDKYDPGRDPSVPSGTKFVGHGYGLSLGDTFLIAMRSGKIGRWVINELKYERDPSDMFWITASFKEYTDG